MNYYQLLELHKDVPKETLKKWMEVLKETDLTGLNCRPDFKGEKEGQPPYCSTNVSSLVSVWKRLIEDKEEAEKQKRKVTRIQGKKK